MAIASFGRGGHADLQGLTVELDERTPGPWGSDTQAADFWAAPPKWAAAGDTPDAALKALYEKNSDVDWPFDGS